MASTVPWGVISTLPNQHKSKESKEKGVSSAYSTNHDQLMKEDGIYKRFVDTRKKAVSWKLEGSL